MRIANYYSRSQYAQMRLIDDLARARQESGGGRPYVICVECGSVDLFRMKIKNRYSVFSTGDGVRFVDQSESVGRVRGTNEISRFDLIDLAHEQGDSTILECVRCGGPVVTVDEVELHCHDRGCLGCMLCGKATPKDEVEAAIADCPECMGGYSQCIGDVDNCPNYFMRIYHGIGKEPIFESDNKSF